MVDTWVKTRANSMVYSSLHTRLSPRHLTRVNARVSPKVDTRVEPRADSRVFSSLH